MMKKKNIAILVSVIVVAVIVILLLLFNLKTYSVMYNTNGGSFIATDKVRVFMKATRPSDPVKDGYTFDNWYYNDGIFDFDTRITQDMIIEARWIEGNPVAGTFVISFNSNGGSSIASVRSNEDGTVNRPEDPVREGYRFVAWQHNGQDFDFESKVKSNMTLVAKWEVDDGSKDSVPAEKVTLSPTTLSLKVGNTRRLTVTLSPNGAVNREMKWTTSNNRVATVDANGTVRAVGVGTATITVEVDGVKATMKVTVTQATSGGNNNGGGNVTPIDPRPEDPEPTPEEPETYSIEYVPEPTSAMGEVYVRIKSSKRGYVSGVVQITTTGGQVINEAVTTGGKLMPRSVIQSAVVVSTN